MSPVCIHALTELRIKYIVSLYPVSAQTITKKCNSFLINDILSEAEIWTE